MMRFLSVFILLFCSAISTAYPMPNAFPPFRIADNLYYVGTDDLTSYLIVTPKGNILINSTLTATVPLIKANIEKLGFRYADTKILLINHAHFDHAQGSALIKRETGASYQVMDDDVPLVLSGGKTDFQYGNDQEFLFPRTKVDRVLKDGDQVSLGNTVLTAHKTPGHTRGNTTWTLTVSDHGKAYQAVIIGSLNANSEYQLKNNKQYPEIVEDYQTSFAISKILPCDIFLGSHAKQFDLAKKYALLGKTKTNPFLDAAGYQKHIAQQEQKFADKLRG